MSSKSLRHLLIAVVAMLVAAAAAAPASAETVTMVFGNTPGETYVTGYYTAEVTGTTGSSVVQFKFLNSDPYLPVSSSITAIYMNDGNWFKSDPAVPTPKIVSASGGVSFTMGTPLTPEELPNKPANWGGTTISLSADSNTPTQPSGIHQGEWLTIEYQLLDTKSWTALKSALATPVYDGIDKLGVGLFVQNIGKSGASGHFVNTGVTPTPPTAVPLPGVAAAGLALVGTRWTRRRRSRGHVA